MNKSVVSIADALKAVESKSEYNELALNSKQAELKAAWKLLSADEQSRIYQLCYPTK